MLDSNVKVTIQVDNKTITFEGPEDFVQKQVERYIDLDTSSNINAYSTTGESEPAQPLNVAANERELIRAKSPRGHPQTVAVLAFALSESGTPEFTEEDIRRAYIRAGVRPPKVVAQAIRDAKNLFDYVEKGRKSGTYRLTNHGDRTVRFDLPRRNSNG